MVMETENKQNDQQIVERIKYLMDELRYKQVEFAEKIDINASNLSKYLNGRLPISSALINRIVVNLGVSKQWLEEGTDLPFAKQVSVVQQAVQEHQGEYEAIVSNPPFFIDSLQAPDEQRNMARHTATLSYGELMKAAHRLLADEGEFSVVVPFDYRQRMEDEAIFVGFFPSRVCGVRTTDRKPVKRYLLAFRKHPCACEKEVLTIGDERYQQLTGAFYLNG